MSNILKGLNEGYFSRDEKDQQNAMDTRRSTDLSRERNAGLNEPDELSTTPAETRNGVYEYNVPAGQEKIAKDLGLDSFKGHWFSRVPVQRADFQFGRPQFHAIPSKNVSEAEQDFGPDYQDKVKRLGQMAKQGERKTVWDPVKRVYKTVPVNPPKQQGVAEGNKQLDELFEPTLNYYTLSNGKKVQVSYRPNPNQSPVPFTDVTVSYVDPALKPMGPSFDSTGVAQPWTSAPDGVKQAIQKFATQSSQGVAEGSLNEGQYEMMMRNGQVKKFIAKDDADAKRIAAGHGAKSVIKLRGGVPAGKVSEQGVAEEQLDELSCWSGYHRVAGTKAGFPGSCAKNKTNEADLAEQSNYDWSAEKEKIRSMSTTQRREYALARLEQTNDDKFAHIASKAGAGHSEIMNAINKGRQGVAEEQHSCPHCGGEMVSEELMNEKKDACYYKVKSRYKVWPSAYASGALVKCRKSGADSWGNGGKKNEGVAEGSKEKTPGIALSKAYKKDFDNKKPGQDRAETALTGTYSKTGKPGGELKKQGVAEDQLDEKWTKKYKDSINCSNPKGFSQKAHCAGKQKNESSILEGINQVEESLHDWFNKEKWVRMDTKGKIKGPCAREPGEGKPKCLPQSKAHSLGKKGRASAASRKRREDPNPERSGKAINVDTKKSKG